MESTDCKGRNHWQWGFKMVGWVIVGAITAAALAFVFGYFIMLLWNWLMPELFGLTTITFWQAFGITLLARLIFGGLGNNGHSKCKSRHDKHKFAKHWGEKCWGKESGKDWRHFNSYWKEEGEKSFKDYIERKKND